MAAAALWGSWCRCPQRCFSSRIQFLSSHNLALLPHGTHQIRRPGGELSLSKSYSSGNRKSFLSGLLDNIKQDLAKNKEMKESIKKFRDEARKLEESDALQEARRKYKTIESETVRTSEVIRRKLGEITGSVKESLDEGGEKLGRTAAFKALSQGVESVRKEIDESVLGQTGPYRRPERLRRRKELSGGKSEGEKVFEPNEEALGVVLHKDSKWYQQWKDFRDNNVVFNRFFEMKLRYDESDNALIRASRALTDKVTDLLGGLFSKTEMSEVLTEILRVDPAFDKDRFLRQCEKDIIPNVLEAMISGELDILKDWCYEATYSQLAHPIQQAKALGLQLHSRVLDIDNVDLAMGKMMEQGPVLIITFQAQLVMVIKNPRASWSRVTGRCCAAHAVCVGPLPETRDELNPLRSLAASGHLRLQYRADSLNAAQGRTLGLDDHPAVDTQGQVLLQQGGLCLGTKRPASPSSQGICTTRQGYSC
ncbi:Mitochondrial import inner membrane translocase subunit TIM44 [Manis javanica]|nr:Mitochondrial import inner membrane translocase subunit TIM44 [Manis javanica]